MTLSGCRNGFGSTQPINLSPERLEISESLLLQFLRRLRDQGAPAWKRLQAARALEWYQSLVLAQSLVDFAPFKLKLAELANVEKRAGESLNNHEVKKRSASFLPILRLLVKLPPGHKTKLYVH